MGAYSGGVHLIYAPFKNSDEQKDAAKHWNKYNGHDAVTEAGDSYDLTQVRRQKNYIFVDDNNPVLDPNLDFSRTDTSAANVMYIIGHCSSGLPFMGASSSMLVWEQITSGGLAERVSKLIGNPGFRGGIKVFGCDSASSTFLTYSFTYYFAKELINEYKYNSCRIFGYTASVTQHVDPYDNSKVGDKFQLRKLSSETYVEFLDGERRKRHKRASTARLLVADNGALVGG